MRTFPPPQHLKALRTGPVHFLEEAGPVLLICVGGSLGVTLFYYWLIDPSKQRQKKSEWLAANQNAMRMHLVLSYGLSKMYKKLPPCTNCGRRALEFWDHGRDLLVFRCRDCRMNHTLSGFHYPEVRVVLENLPGLFVILNELRRQPDSLLGRHLIQQCGAMDWYCRKSLNKGNTI